MRCVYGHVWMNGEHVIRKNVMEGLSNSQAVMSDINSRDITQKQDINAGVLDEWTAFLQRYQHDLQGPLRNIANFLQILKDELSKFDVLDKSATLKCISAAEHCVYTLNSINISQLLDNRNSVDVFNLEKLLEPLYCLLLSQLNERKCKIDIEPDIPHIIGNKDEILRVFKNLIENSLNHAKTDKPLLIKIQKLCQRDMRVMLQFCDNGKTLSSRDYKKICDSFKSPVSGISIANSLLTKNHGYLQLVKSDVGCLWELELPVGITQSHDINHELQVNAKNVRIQV